MITRNKIPQEKLAVTRERKKKGKVDFLTSLVDFILLSLDGSYEQVYTFMEKIIFLGLCSYKLIPNQVSICSSDFRKKIRKVCAQCGLSFFGKI